ncbi:hypothetical protein [Candidatus Phytoplasma solani]|uniref:hypothetical protein n=1 Tax=Candidatus Phytoplasma solani TaxID=69896 RepID=UPI00358ECC29
MPKIIRKENIIVYFFLFLSVFCCLLCIIQCLEFIYKNKTIKKPLTPSLEETQTKFVLTQKLAYLGLNQFIDGLYKNQFKEKYVNIFRGDGVLFEDKVLNGTLGTASTPLIQGTLDFLAQLLKQKLNLIVNDIHYLSSFNSYNQVIDLKMRNNGGNHFYIHKPQDTQGDGYCFFHAIIFLLKEKVLLLEQIINNFFAKFDLITTNQKIINEIKKIKAN